MATDLTARARIRDAALLRIGRDGYAATSVRKVAKDAGVSPGLVIHHFGSKAGLRAACDEHVLAIVADRRRYSAAPTDWLAELHTIAELRPVAAYLTAAMTDDSGMATRLFDEIADATLVFLKVGAEAGYVRPEAARNEMALSLTAMALGVFVLQDHLARGVGASDGFAAMTDPGLMLAMTEIMARGVFAGQNVSDIVEQALAERKEQA